MKQVMREKEKNLSSQTVAVKVPEITVSGQIDEALLKSIDGDHGTIGTPRSAFGHSIKVNTAAGDYDHHNLNNENLMSSDVKMRTDHFGKKTSESKQLQSKHNLADSGQRILATANVLQQPSNEYSAAPASGRFIAKGNE